MNLPLFSACQADMPLLRRHVHEETDHLRAIIGRSLCNMIQRQSRIESQAKRRSYRASEVAAGPHIYVAPT